MHYMHYLYKNNYAAGIAIMTLICALRFMKSLPDVHYKCQSKHITQLSCAMSISFYWPIGCFYFVLVFCIVFLVWITDMEHDMSCLLLNFLHIMVHRKMVQTLQ